MVTLEERGKWSAPDVRVVEGKEVVVVISGTSMEEEIWPSATAATAGLLGGKEL